MALPLYLRDLANEMNIVSETASRVSDHSIVYAEFQTGDADSAWGHFNNEHNTHLETESQRENDGHEVMFGEAPLPRFKKKSITH